MPSRTSCPAGRCTAAADGGRCCPTARAAGGCFALRTVARGLRPSAAPCRPLRAGARRALTRAANRTMRLRCAWSAGPLPAAPARRPCARRPSLASLLALLVLALPLPPCCQPAHAAAAAAGAGGWPAAVAAAPASSALGVTGVTGARSAVPTAPPPSENRGRRGRPRRKAAPSLAPAPPQTWHLVEPMPAGPAVRLAGRKRRDEASCAARGCDSWSFSAPCNCDADCSG